MFVRDLIKRELFYGKKACGHHAVKSAIFFNNYAWVRDNAKDSGGETGEWETCYLFLFPVTLVSSPERGNPDKKSPRVMRRDLTIYLKGYLFSES